MSKTAIQIKGLKKSYNNTPALKGVDIEISKGEFFGLLGPNGAGKTTTINILTGLVFKDEGTCLVFEKDIAKYFGASNISLFKIKRPREVEQNRNTP